MSERKITKVIYHGVEYEIEYEIKPISHRDAWRPCGNGVWIYSEERNSLERVSIGSHHDIPYSFEAFNPNNKYHKVTASSKPLWVWWGEGCNKLDWGDIGIALPKSI